MAHLGGAARCAFAAYASAARDFWRHPAHASARQHGGAWMRDSLARSDQRGSQSGERAGAAVGGSTGRPRCAGSSRSPRGPRSSPPNASARRSPGRRECRSRRCGAEAPPTGSAGVERMHRSPGVPAALPALRRRDWRSASLRCCGLSATQRRCPALRTLARPADRTPAARIPSTRCCSAVPFRRARRVRPIRDWCWRA